MKTLTNVIRVIIGVLFIFSGLVKANDPLGLSYKMQEFFEVWGWHGLNDYTLVFSILMIVFEIVAGVAVLVGWQMRLFSWLLLLLIIFFAFLTGYAVLSGKVRECGCFGDCIPLKANQSFMKDLILLVLILFLFARRSKIPSPVPPLAGITILLLATIFSFAFQWYVLQHLPVVDCLPYKVGNNIPEKMKISPDAIPDSVVIMYTYQKDGKEVKFSAGDFPEDFDDSYTFVKRDDEVVREGNAVAPIKDFALQTVYGNDTTLALLNEPGYKLFLFVKDGYETGDWAAVLEVVNQQAAQKNIDGYLVTNIQMEALRKTAPASFHAYTPLRCDAVAVKTAARTNPELYLIKEGTIVHKWGYADFEQALPVINGLEKNPPPPPVPEIMDDSTAVADSTITTP